MTVSNSKNSSESEDNFEYLGSKSFGEKKQKYIRKNRGKCTKRPYYDHSLSKIHGPWRNSVISSFDNYIKHDDRDALDTFILVSKNSYSYWY